VARRVLNGYKCLVKDSNIDDQGFMEFDTVAPIGELRIFTSYMQPYQNRERNRQGD
jgi:hypothetical protein